MVLKPSVMVLLVGVLSSGLHREADGARECSLWCPAGQYVHSDCKCSNCSHGSYTKNKNRERECHSCFRDCKPELHMQEEKPCTTVSDVVCRCMTGFFCPFNDSVSNQCIRCLHAPANSSTNSPSTTSPTPQPPGRSTTVVLLFVILVSIIITPLFCRRRKKECIKQLVKRCSLGNQKEDHDTTSSVCKETKTQEFMTANTFNSSRSDSSAHHTSSPEQPPPPAGNLGPLHIYGAGTVFVSLLNQFGQNEGEKDEEDPGQPVVDMREVHCPRSPPLPLSKEERNRDECYVSFPSQEQGKECHMSKEEGL
ncbi:uncharacterized protein LOC143489427 isoform X2 [Brachyhypopomus gauderio]|uniref:uncharacterized protein LOC143489427 isoform X2 n=1 Tax=Brachyhypopomus gauderio TaxID=698409 RepID=UPI004042E7A0